MPPYTLTFAAVLLSLLATPSIKQEAPSPLRSVCILWKTTENLPSVRHLIDLVALDSGVEILNMATMKQNRKKKRVSKHVLQAQEARKVSRPINDIVVPGPPQNEPMKQSEVQPKKPKKSKTNKQIITNQPLYSSPPSSWGHIAL